MKVHAVVENIMDVLAVAHGRLAPGKVRRIEVHDAGVDTAATMLLLPKRFVTELGIRSVRTQQGLFSAVRLTVQGRGCTIDVEEVGDESPVIIGRIPLLAMDWVVDPRAQKLIGNPEHGGEQIIEVFSVAIDTINLNHHGADTYACDHRR